MYRENVKKRFRIKISNIKTDFINYFQFGKQRIVIDNRADKREKDYLAIAVIAKDEGKYIREFIEFHLLAGVDRIYFFDNESADDTRKKLEPYISTGKVIYIFFPGKNMQFPAYRFAIRYCKSYTKWLALIDADEFLYSPDGELKDNLKEFEGEAGVGVNWVCFGPSGHDKSPQGLVIENYRQTFLEADHLFNRHIKSIVDPKKVESVNSPHYCRYRKGKLAVDENHIPIGNGEYGVKGERLAFTEHNSCKKLKINHYITKSLEDLRKKGKRGYPDGMPNNVFDESVQRFNVPLKEDLAIQKFVPRLKEKANEL